MKWDFGLRPIDLSHRTFKNRHGKDRLASLLSCAQHAEARVGEGPVSSLRYMCNLLAALALASGTAYAQATNSNDAWAGLKKLNWQFNGVGHIGNQASIQIPAGYAFLGASDELSPEISSKNG